MTILEALKSDDVVISVECNNRWLIYKNGEFSVLHDDYGAKKAKVLVRTAYEEFAVATLIKGA